MSEQPRYGQRSRDSYVEYCPRHPGRRAVAFCKRCNRPMCEACTIRTEVGSICVDCARETARPLAPGMPVVTYATIGVCAIAYIATLVDSRVNGALAFVPLLGYTQPWRFLTTAFLHASFLHILFNMFALYFVGPPVERALGHARFAALYLLSAIGGSVGVLAWGLVQPAAFTTVTVGASGAVFGLFAAIFILQHLQGSNTTAVLILLVVNLAYGFLTPGVSWQAHVGGMLTGAAVTFVLVHTARPRRGWTQRRQDALSAAVVAGMFALLAALAWAIYQVAA